MMRHASLFSGIGGFDLAAEWAGWRNVFNCEIDPFCRRVLKHHFPNTVQYEDIAKSDFSEWDGRIDVLTGGFPCQPFSVAGKRRGTEDDRYLWPAMLSAVRAVRPRWVVAENVYGIISQADGLVFEQVFADLEAEGYEVGAYVLPACGVGAPHRRYRTWFIAHRSDTRAETLREGEDCVHAVGPAADTECFRGLEIQQTIQSEQSKSSRFDCYGDERASSDTDGERCYEQFLSEESGETEAEFGGGYYAAIPDWSGFPTESPVCGGDDGLPEGLVGITLPRWRREAIKACGNAIVPQVAYMIFKTINEYEKR